MARYHAPLYPVKGGFSLTSWIGTGYSCYEEYKEHKEKMQEETRNYWRNAPLMVRFTAKVHDIIREAYAAEAKRTAHGKRSAEFWRLDDAIRTYRDRLAYYERKAYATE